MTEITKSITYLNEYKSLKKAVDEGKTPVLTVGLSAIHKGESGGGARRGYGASGARADR